MPKKKRRNTPLWKVVAVLLFAASGFLQQMEPQLHR